MTIENPKYDVAISFLSKDEAIASAIHQRLTEGLGVFFYPRRQEELAGTDGLESMRKPFFDDSRLVVVLYREPWGKTPWTRVEETAIKEGCFKHGWERLFFIVLDAAGALPIWLPQTLVHFNYADFGLEQAVGAIKGRVQDNGGQLKPLTAQKRAEMFEAQEQFRRDKARMNSEEGAQRVFGSVVDLFREIEKLCTEINARKGSLRIDFESCVNQRSAHQACTLTDGRVGLQVTWSQPFSNSLASSALFVREYAGGLILPSEMGRRMYLDRPEMTEEIRYSPELSLAREYGWKEDGKSEFLSSPAFAQHCVIRFVDLVNRYAHPEAS